MPKAIIFDFDGVIVESFPVCYAVTKMYDPDITEEEYKMMFTGNIYDSLTIREKRIKKEPDPNFDFFAEYTKKIISLKPVVGLEEVLKKAKNNKVNVFIISSTTSEPIKNYLKINNLLSYFTDILCGDIERSKVKKFEMIKERTGLKSKEILFVTDTLGDLIEADKVGINSVAVSYGFHDKKTLSKFPKKIQVLDSIEDLTKLIKS